MWHGANDEREGEREKGRIIAVMAGGYSLFLGRGNCHQPPVKLALLPGEQCSGRQGR